MIRVLIADDQMLFRTMLEEMLRAEDGILLLNSATNGDEAVRLSINGRPDVVLMDIQMPGRSGVEALRAVKEMRPETRVIMLTTFENVNSVKESLAAGADGYLLKEMRPDTLVMAIKCCSQGIAVMHDSAYAMTRTLFAEKEDSGTGCEYGGIVFDSTEISIICHIAEGRTNKDIARALNYSEGTIKNRVSRILAATGLNDRTQISVFAIKNGII